MTTLLHTLRSARDALACADTAQPGEASVARRVLRELDEAIANLEGAPPEKDLLSVVCHDLKDPLASIVMGSSFLRKTLPPDEGARRIVDAIARSAERMNQVVSDFHDLSRLEAGTLEIERRPVDVASVVRSVVDAHAARAKELEVELQLEAPDAPLVASCDRARVGQMLAKLLANALKFTGPRGRVLVRAWAEGGEARLSVADTGRGIAEADLKSIFDRTANARRKPRNGPGLGLPMVRGLVEAQGGKVTVTSRPGEGSTFTVALVLSSPPENSRC
jgi:signal transduction histidine kinase